MDATSPGHERFLALLDAHRRALLKVCWAYANASHDRDDLLQEIIGRLWSAFPRYDACRVFSTWMYRVALNVAIDFQRRQRRRGSRTGPLDADVADPSPNDPAREHQLLDLRAPLDQQDDADRALLVLYLEGHAHREIGDVLGLSESNVGTRLNRLKQSMRAAALGRGTGDPPVS